MGETTGSLLITNGRVIDPTQHLDARADVLIVDGRVAEIAEAITREGIPVLDATGCVVAPGFVDMHVHLREPGFEHKEDIATGTRAAAAGGFTSVACMPNTQPPIDNSGIVDLVKHRAAAVGAVNVFPIGSITRGMDGKELANAGELVEAGAVALSDDGHPLQDAYVLRRALEYARMFDVVFISHPEDKDLSVDGVMHEGHYSTLLGLKGIPAASEEVQVSRDILLGEMTGTAVHIAHISSAGSVRMVREAKARGVRITAEATPHHIALSDACLVTYDSNLKMNPPLRTEADREELKRGLADGTIDAIATDHAPHAPSEKEVEFDYAAFGVIGLESALPVVLTELCHGGVLTLSHLVEKLAVNPARILRIEKGSLKVGMDGDVTVFDPDREVTLDVNTFASKSRNCPFHGWTLKGVPVASVVAGTIRWQRGPTAAATPGRS